MKKRYVYATLILLSGLSVGGLTLTKGDATDDPTQIAQVVAHQGEVLDNHEARITNTENDVKDLQSNTNTPPSTTRVSVPTPSQPAPTPTSDPTPAPTPQPAPVTVVAYEQIPIENSENIDCRYTYSDSTTYQWDWKTVEYNQGTKMIHFKGICDASAIGKPK